MKKTNYLLSAVIFIILSLFIACGDDDELGPEPKPPTPPEEKTDVLTKIPDPVFKKYIEDNMSEYDQDKDGILSEPEAADIYKLNLDNYFDNPKIESLQGIEYFTGLRTLHCGWNKLTTIDLSKNTKLSQLSCGFNNLSVLDLSNNTELVEVSCSDAKLKKLDISKNAELKRLYCHNNQLETLSFCKESQITELYCLNNQLKTLDLSNTSRLDKLDCSNNQLTALSLKSNEWISRLICNNNRLNSLIINESKYIFEVNCSHNQLTTIDTKKCEELAIFYCEDNQLETLDLTSNICLLEIKAKENPSLKDIHVWKGFDASEIELFEIPDNTKIIEQN